jgi:hypothetical protein
MKQIVLPYVRTGDFEENVILLFCIRGKDNFTENFLFFLVRDMLPNDVQKLRYGGQ